MEEEYQVEKEEEEKVEEENVQKEEEEEQEEEEVEIEKEVKSETEAREQDIKGSKLKQRYIPIFMHIQINTFYTSIQNLVTE